nr:hypothetical protein [Tanacetum cinerariifolium]
FSYDEVGDGCYWGCLSSQFNVNQEQRWIDDLEITLSNNNLGRSHDIYRPPTHHVSPATEANYVVAVNALRAVDFHFLAQLASHKDSSMFVLMDLLRLEGPVAETLEAEQLQPSPD